MKTVNLVPKTSLLMHKIQDKNLPLEERMKAQSEYRKFTTEHGINPLQTFLPILCNSAIFTTMFFSLRGMAELPVESMKTGGS